MPRAWSPCSTPGCPTLTPHSISRCQQHTRQADLKRGTASQRGYTSTGHKTFRRDVLTQDPLCVLCGLVATDADHHPQSRKQLIELGLDPNNPHYGRGLCGDCHKKETAQHQPGGWNTDDYRYH